MRSLFSDLTGTRQPGKIEMVFWSIQFWVDTVSSVDKDQTNQILFVVEIKG